ncbi:MAG: archaeosortase/exosortase family protein [Verrucomicrobiota bacterium]
MSINAAALRVFPQIETGLFVRAAAWLAGVVTGSPVEAADGGWVFHFHGLPMLVSAACSASDYWLLVTALLGWQLARVSDSPIRAGLAACLLAAPVAIAVNVARLATLAVAHRWLIPLAPDTYANVLHLLLGVSVFLPALIALNALLDHRHARLQSRAVS